MNRLSGIYVEKEIGRKDEISYEIRGGFLNDHDDNKVFVETHIKFLQYDYINNYKPKRKLALEELSRNSYLVHV